MSQVFIITVGICPPLAHNCTNTAHFGIKIPKSSFFSSWKFHLILISLYHLYQGLLCFDVCSFLPFDLSLDAFEQLSVAAILHGCSNHAKFFLVPLPLPNPNPPLPPTWPLPSMLPLPLPAVTVEILDLQFTAE